MPRGSSRRGVPSPLWLSAPLLSSSACRVISAYSLLRAASPKARIAAAKHHVCRAHDCDDDFE